MKTPVNNVTVHNFKPLPVETEYPVTITDENGGRRIVHQVISDSTINTVMADDYSLRSLINAGVDPSKMSVKTSQYSKQDEIFDVLQGLSNVEMPEVQNNPEN